MTLTPNALRLRRLLIQHTCRATTELSRQSRMDDLVEDDLARCVWCGSWTDGLFDGLPCCQRCAQTHQLTTMTTMFGVTP